jgi:hypothetical protein
MVTRNTFLSNEFPIQKNMAGISAPAWRTAPLSEPLKLFEAEDSHFGGGA